MVSSFLILLYASVLDIKYREVDSRLWKLIIAIGSLLILADVFLTKNPRLLLPFTIILFIAVVFSFSLDYFGLMGAGDAKLIIGLGAMFPFLPKGNFILPTFFLSVFTNAILLGLLINLWVFVLNIKHLRDVRHFNEFVRLFGAYKKDANEVGQFEAVLDEGKLFLGTKNAEFGRGVREGEVWVSYALPFVVFMTIGFLISVSYGDAIAIIL
jgi:preflagellin peptidase FlaK